MSELTAKRLEAGDLRDQVQHCLRPRPTLAPVTDRGNIIEKAKCPPDVPFETFLARKARQCWIYVKFIEHSLNYHPSLRMLAAGKFRCGVNGAP